MSEIHLVNGQRHTRTRGSEGCTVLECGCAHAEVMWLQLCDLHWQEWSRERRDAYLAQRAHTRAEDKRS